MRQHVVRGAVDDPGNPFDVIARKAFAERLDQRNSAGNGGFERHHDAGSLSGVEDLVAVQRHQGLVGGHHVLAVGQGPLDQTQGRLDAADELHDHRNLRIVHELGRAGGQRERAGK